MADARTQMARDMLGYPMSEQEFRESHPGHIYVDLLPLHKEDPDPHDERIEILRNIRDTLMPGGPVIQPTLLLTGARRAYVPMALPANFHAMPEDYPLTLDYCKQNGMDITRISLAYGEVDPFPSQFGDHLDGERGVMCMLHNYRIPFEMGLTS